MVFCAQMSEYRLTLPKEIRDDDALLLSTDTRPESAYSPR
jgi:hypothetical protein